MVSGFSRTLLSGSLPDLADPTMTTINETKQVKTEDDITSEVLRRFDVTADARLREIMQSLVTHLHAFAREVRLTDKEWLAGIEFLTAVGKKCSDNRQEFIRGGGRTGAR